ncbi:chymotrypsin-1-like [Danaus plexippus]|uniref:chymotrypsin-1-like n=1 Tax=Danaus plexippus TaxID=13037 RepID=UPI002AB1E4F1|nr:chymotrypsin-1-like [Danaus plexippus]
MFQAGCLFISLLVGSIGLPLSGGYTSGYFGDIKARVINGYDASPVPHMVALTVGEQSKSLVCGASLITKRHVLTAAHCIDAFIDKGKLSRSLTGIVGTNDWNKGGTHYTFSGNITHPEWDSKMVNNDIGILITSQPVTLNKYVQIITLNFQFIAGNVAAIINGWGQFEKESKRPSHGLKELKLYTLDGSACTSRLRRRKTNFILNSTLQISTITQKNYGAGPGDSGSPLILRDNRQQIGVVSWGVNPSASGYPDVYGRISAYKSWIKQSVRLRI